MPERHNYICLFFMKLDLILLRGNFFSKAKFHNNKYCPCITHAKKNCVITSAITCMILCVITSVIFYQKCDSHFKSHFFTLQITNLRSVIRSVNMCDLKVWITQKKFYKVWSHVWSHLKMRDFSKIPHLFHTLSHFFLGFKKVWF